jgi:hypothetical protein
MGGWRTTVAAAAAGAGFFIGSGNGFAQVVEEPAMLAAGVPAGETFLPYIAFPENSFVIGGMIRFPVSDDVDIGGRAGLWLRDNADDTPYAGADVRYGLLARPLTDGGGLLNLSFDFGIGLSEPGVTVWKIPVGFIAGIGFKLAGGDSEVFTHPRLEFGIGSGDENTDSALMLDLGGIFTITEQIGAVLDFRFGNGLFGEGDGVVIALGAIWRL